MFRHLYLILFILGGNHQSLSQNLEWSEIQSDISYLNSQRFLFERVEDWLEGTRVESILMDSIYIKNRNSPQKAMLNVYHSGSFDPSVLEIPLKQIDSITHDDYVLNLHVSTLILRFIHLFTGKEKYFKGITCSTFCYRTI